MTARPEILFPLFSELESLGGVGAKTAKALGVLKIDAPRDLLFSLPYSGVDRKFRASVAEVEPGAVATIEVEVVAHRPGRSRQAPYRVEVRDALTSFTLVFFHANGDWLHKQLPVGEKRVVSGKVEAFDGQLQIAHPDFIVTPAEVGKIPDFEPVYRLTSGVTSKLMLRAVGEVLSRMPVLKEWIDPGLKAKEHWPDWQDALRQAHAPSGPDDLSPLSAARRRLAYDELFAHQLTLALARSKVRRGVGQVSLSTGKLQNRVLEHLPYEPTKAQIRAVKEIAEDMASGNRMNRLLQGDVGAGKTLVAVLALLIAVEAGGQGVMMAPTEILARQHLQGIRPLAEHAGVVVEILTGRDKGSERRAKLDALARGDIHILVGTHAVFQEDVKFYDLRLSVVDEQHRFGVAQRMQLGEKGIAADVLVMTATPIPRSLALAQYGDMDVSVLDEKPPGRKPIKTVLVPSGRLEEVVARLQSAIETGTQAYWVCPLVDESEVMNLTAAEERFKHLRAALGEGNVGLVHGQMAGNEKDQAMSRFQRGETKVLVATTVIEVGVDVPNATIMVIEGAEHFGLAQLHQLRGRVGRGQAASTCLMLYQPPLTAGGEKRLATMRDTEDGFVIAEADLEMRGAGDLIGTAQSGLPQFWVADLEHQSGLMAVAQKDARLLLANDPGLETERGHAARVLLWLMRQDQAIRLISVG
ncbi:ATP-dependent DNA helicase RecG [Aliiroseovarius crassostreae]|uniref:ATP-dependent DNA helicase RecG n=1 Tax=Aliiroseovarius crassostreae TaxID=154981 RepID=UPI0021AF62AE|nr:ATP-dependent DNA helicase RecG [Aliiroseovarius crassostreae]UWQ12371.1 ATP-dependent DNA helicase RecG [Aliiroseovarius crassostreae]